MACVQIGRLHFALAEEVRSDVGSVSPGRAEHLRSGRGLATAERTHGVGHKRSNGLDRA